MNRVVWSWCGLASVALGCVAGVAQQEQHMRGWKPLPPTSHIVVTVEKAFNDKPLVNAAVVFHALRDGRDDGNLEVKTDPEGRATIDIIEIGSKVTVQVIADGYATAARDMDVDGPNKELLVKMVRPRAQVSTYVDSGDKPAPVQPGIQEHVPGTLPQATTDGSPKGVVWARVTDCRWRASVRW
jgi:hypothetical protein